MSSTKSIRKSLASGDEQFLEDLGEEFFSKKKKKPKSQSQKIRGRIYVIWELRGKPGEFEDYYNKITNHFIKKLDQKISSLGG